MITVLIRTIAKLSNPTASLLLQCNKVALSQAWRLLLLEVEVRCVDDAPQHVQATQTQARRCLPLRALRVECARGLGATRRDRAYCVASHQPSQCRQWCNTFVEPRCACNFRCICRICWLIKECILCIYSIGGLKNAMSETLKNSSLGATAIELATKVKVVNWPSCQPFGEVCKNRFAMPCFELTGRNSDLHHTESARKTTTRTNKNISWTSQLFVHGFRKRMELQQEQHC